MTNFATRIKQLRMELPGNVSQLDLAKALGARFPDSLGKMTDRTIGSWESGASPPRWGHALLLAEFFGVSLDYLAGWSDKRGHAPMHAASDDHAQPADSDGAVAELGVLGDARRAGRRREPKRRGSSERRSES